MDLRPPDLNTDFNLVGCLFASVKYVYSAYTNGFETQIEYSLPDGSVGKNVIIFGSDMSSSVHIDNEGKDILSLGKDITQGLDNTTLVVETLYSISFTRLGIKFCLSLHYNWSNSFLFVNATKIYYLKAKDSEIKKYYFC